MIAAAPQTAEAWEDATAAAAQQAVMDEVGLAAVGLSLFSVKLTAGNDTVQRNGSSISAMPKQAKADRSKWRTIDKTTFKRECTHHLLTFSLA